MLVSVAAIAAKLGCQPSADAVRFALGEGPDDAHRRFMERHNGDLVRAGIRATNGPFVALASQEALTRRRESGQEPTVAPGLADALAHPSPTNGHRQTQASSPPSWLVGPDIAGRPAAPSTVIPLPGFDRATRAQVPARTLGHV